MSDTKDIIQGLFEKWAEDAEKLFGEWLGNRDPRVVPFGDFDNDRVISWDTLPDSEKLAWVLVAKRAYEIYN